MEDRVCPKCGLDPSLGLEPSAVAQANFSKMQSSVSSSQSDLVSNREVGSRKRIVPRYFMVKLISAWLLLLVAIVVGARLRWPAPSSKAPFEDKNSPKVQVTAAEDRKSTRLNSSHRNTSRMPSSA